MAAADTNTAKDAITNFLNSEDDQSFVKNGDKVIEEKINEIEVKEGTNAVVDVNNHGNGYYDYSASLPLEFYHYYHGSSTDMGTLIEVSFVNL